MSQNEEWVTLRIFKSLVEAEIVYGLLQYNEVPSRIQGKDSVRPEIAYATGIYIQVPREYLEIAEDLLPKES